MVLQGLKWAIPRHNRVLQGLKWAIPRHNRVLQGLKWAIPRQASIPGYPITSSFFRDWSRGSYIQNLAKGRSEQCPDSATGFGNEQTYSIDEESAGYGSLIGYGPHPPAPILDLDGSDESINPFPSPQSSGMELAGGLSLLALAVIVALIGGVLAGYRISQWRMVQRTKRAAGSSSSDASRNGGSSQGSNASDDYVGYAPSSR
jgi:hypothetical protein